MIRFIAAGMLIAGTAAMSACASAQAKTAAERPALAVPPPPPRIVGPIESTSMTPAPVAELPPAPAPNRPARTSPSREPAREPAKPEARPDAAPEQPAPTPPATSAVPQLSTPQTVDSTEASKTVRATLDRANSLLGGVDYRRLSAERRTQYDTAKRFIQQAEVAIKAGNLVYAESLAEKADTIAKELAGK